MSYTLAKPYTNKQKLDFIVEYNHNKGLKIQEDDNTLYALEAWEEVVNGAVISDKEKYEAQKLQEEKEKISKLSLTKREVFLALYKAKNITPEQLKSQIADVEALIEFEYANEYYRGNPLIDKIGETLGYSSQELDYLFINKELPIEDSNARKQDDEEDK